MGGAYNTHGPPLIIFGCLRQWSAPQFRATLQSYFLLVGSMILFAHALGGLWTASVLRHYVTCLPLCLVAFFLGRFFCRRIAPERFQRLVHWGILLIGISLLLNVLLTEPTASGRP